MIVGQMYLAAFTRFSYAVLSRRFGNAVSSVPDTYPVCRLPRRDIGIGLEVFSHVLCINQQVGNPKDWLVYPGQS